MRRLLQLCAVLLVLALIMVTALIAAGSTESLAEFKSIRVELGKIDLNGPAAKTTGWDNVSEAEWPFFALTDFGYSGCNLAQQHSAESPKILEEVL